jgi:hypothetical protein
VRVKRWVADPSPHDPVTDGGAVPPAMGHGMARDPEAATACLQKSSLRRWRGQFSKS